MKRPKIAIVGLGPRGLGALEALDQALSGFPTSPEIDVFDSFAVPGAGPNFDPAESTVCLLNIPLRDIDVAPSDAFTATGPFAEWLGEGVCHADDFPTRAEMGRYLAERYDDLMERLVFPINRQPMRVDALSEGNGGWMLKAANTVFGPYTEVLLALGQPAEEPDDQIAEWREHVAKSRGTLADAYPARLLEKRAETWAGRTVAVRGLALSAFDVIRVLTLAQGGRIENGRYVPSGGEPARILPFSLDGRPPYPKPSTSEVDAGFQPSEKETEKFLECMREAALAEPEAAHALVNDALLPVVERLQKANGGATEGICEWLATEWQSPGAQETGAAMDALRQGLAMADGSSAPSIGYTVGQVWRKWQDELRRGYDTVRKVPRTSKKLIAFDEGLKRYSYGPPVSSCRELVALVEAGIVDLTHSADPDVHTVAEGWVLRANGQETRVDVMIDGVLPSPDLSKVVDPLVQRMFEDGVLCPVAEGGGVKTAPDGTVISKHGSTPPGLSLLGRLALGSVIGVDSLHDCFGDASRRWAEGVAKRIGH